MITLRPSAERGHFDHGWLNTYHTFSFGDYTDPDHMGYRSLRVINEDRVAPGEGFGMHPHADMEIVTYVLDGALRHEDSMGEGGIIRPGDVQRMSAGTGVRHSEANASTSEPVHLLQIWIVPERRGIAPSYEQKHFEPDALRNTLACVVAPHGMGGALSIHQDARIYAARLDAGRAVRHELAEGRGGWIQVARGALDLNGVTLRAGDGASVEGANDLTLGAIEDAELLLFDLA